MSANDTNVLGSNDNNKVTSTLELIIVYLFQMA